MNDRDARDAPGRSPSAPPLACEDAPDEPPPVLGRWSRLYALVALELVVVILVLWWLTRRFA